MDRAFQSPEEKRLAQARPSSADSWEQHQVGVYLALSAPVNEPAVPSRVLAVRRTGDAEPTPGLPTALVHVEGKKKGEKAAMASQSKFQILNQSRSTSTSGLLSSSHGCAVGSAQ